MLEGIALTIIKTMVSFMFEQYLYTVKDVNIENAPNWYYQQESEKICSFSVIDGDYKNIDILKLELLGKLQKEIQDINDRVIYENFDKISSVKEKNIIIKFKNSKNLKNFVRFNIEYNKIEYKLDVNRVFGKSCIDKNLILSFNKKRLQQIVKEVSLYKSSIEFNELDSGHSENRYFQELESEF